MLVDQFDDTSAATGDAGHRVVGDHDEEKTGLKLVAMADVFDDKLNTSYQTLSKDKQVGDMVDVSKDRQFIGFDGYKKAIDCLSPGDVVLLTTHAAFRHRRRPAVSPGDTRVFRSPRGANTVRGGSSDQLPARPVNVLRFVIPVRRLWSRALVITVVSI